MSKHASTRSAAVYRRTSQGHNAALSWRQSILQGEWRRLLLMVNGFTPLHDLVEVGGFQRDAAELADNLLASGLIEPATDSPALSMTMPGKWCLL